MAEGAEAAPQERFIFDVSDPEQVKGGALEFPFWVYSIRSKINVEGQPRQSTEVKRRYNDFKFLREQLAESHPYCIIPPLPEATLTSAMEKIVGGSQDSDMLKYRQRALKRFLMRVGAHHELYRAPLFIDFLRMDVSELERKKKFPQKPFLTRLAATEGSGVVASLQENIASLVRGSGAGGSPTPGGETICPAQGYDAALSGTQAPTPARVWSETRVYIGQFENSLSMLKTKLNQLIQRRRDASDALREFSRSFTKVGEAESREHSSALSNAILAMANHSQALSTKYLQHADTEVRTVVETINYYIGMCAAVREALDRLNSALHLQENLQHKVSELRMSKSKAEAEPPSAKKGEKVRKLEQELQLKTETRDRVVAFTRGMESNFKQQLRVFHREKQYDIKSMLKSFTELQLTYSKTMGGMWEELEPSLKQL